MTAAVDLGLTGRKALITGGSRGIGRAAAILFARAGCDVAISFRNRGEAAAAVRDEVARLGRECLEFQAEISSEPDVRAMIEGCRAAWGRVDILVNNAGIWTYGEMGAMPKAVWDETMRVNLDGVYLATNAVVPLMKARGRGAIIHVSSTAAVRGEAFHSHYAASKAALHALTKSLAVELAAFGIRVNAVAPGWVDTDMCEETFAVPGARAKIEETIPLGRVPPPEDIAGPIVFLASDLARHITGEILNVNGGSVLCGG
ncbi:MAG: SDR family oxidoreductase [Candidatus Aminicenantes bacterium]|nr:SDR family oxidoreductase [Candidatus Aminicenantes bacterium]